MQQQIVNAMLPAALALRPTSAASAAAAAAAVAPPPALFHKRQETVFAFQVSEGDSE